MPPDEDVTVLGCYEYCSCCDCWCCCWDCGRCYFRHIPFLIPCSSFMFVKKRFHFVISKKKDKGDCAYTNMPFHSFPFKPNVAVWSGISLLFKNDRGSSHVAVSSRIVGRKLSSKKRMKKLQNWGLTFEFQYGQAWVPFFVLLFHFNYFCTTLPD